MDPLTIRLQIDAPVSVWAAVRSLENLNDEKKLPARYRGDGSGMVDSAPT